MYTTTTLIIWALVALATGFAAGWMVGLFRWKNSPVKAESESTAIREGWRQILAQHSKELQELADKIYHRHLAQPEEAKSDASKKL